MPQKQRLLLIDGYAVAYRAYHAMPPLTTPDGEPSNAVFGFANMLLKAIADLEPTHVVAAFDVGKTFRHEEYEAYKATRAETPDDLRVQFDRIKDLVRIFGVPIYEKQGFEADDVLGTLTKQAEEEGIDSIILTGDSDTFQLISDRVHVFYPQGRNAVPIVMDIKAVEDRYGLSPAQLIDLKALVGDSSDNIPGVSGIGPKTATPLLQKYGDIEGIYAHLDEITQKRAHTALENGRETADFSRHLITIVRDIDDIKLDMKTAFWGDYDRTAVVDFMRKMGFSSLVERVPGRKEEGETQLALFGQDAVAAASSSVDVAPASVPADCVYAVIDTKEALVALVERLRAAGFFAFDTETDGTDAMRAHLVGISVSDKEHEGFYIPIGHRTGESARQLSLDQVCTMLGPVFADAAVLKTAHNAKYDMTILQRHGMPVAGIEFDTMIAAWLADPSERLGLKALALSRLGVEMTPITDLIGKGKGQVTIDVLPIDRVAMYASADADMTLRLMELLRKELEDKGQIPLLRDMEMPLLPVLMSMEMHGMVVDIKYLADMSTELEKRLGEITSSIYEYTGHPFNLNSPKQLGEVLFDELGLPVVRRTRTGYSTDAAVLDELIGKHPIVELILEFRQLDKLKSTYVDALPGLVNPQTGRVHTWLSQTGTTTGRLSSRDPNLQNIPVRSDLGRLVRGAFVAPEGCMLLGCDYSQVELRILAHISQDPELLGAFHRDEDVHASTAAAVLGIPLNEVTKEQRSLAKAINFGLMYGMQEYGLSARTNLSVEEARQFIAAYFARFGKVRDYLDGTIVFAREHGYVETLMGRRRYFPELREDSHANGRIKRESERAAINMPIQGSAADIIKIAMIRLQKRLQDAGVKAAMVLQVHDELILEVPDEELDTVRDMVVETMMGAYKLDIPLKVEVAIARNWMEMK